MPTKTLDRWPPAYDQADLKKNIEELVDRQHIFSRFYGPKVPGSIIAQGDIIALSTDIPFLDEEGNPAVMDSETVDYWMITSVTCDLDRAEVSTAHLVPIFNFINKLDVGHSEKYRKYRAYRSFYLPPWDVSVEKGFFVADLITPVTIDKSALTSQCKPPLISYTHN